MASQDISTVNTSLTTSVDLGLRALPPSNTDSSPASATVSPLKHKRGRPFKSTPKLDSSAQSSVPTTSEETKHTWKPKVSAKGHKKGKDSGEGADCGELLSTTMLLALEAEGGIDSDALTTTDPALSSLDNSQMASDESLLTAEEMMQENTSNERVKVIGEVSEVGYKVATTPKKKRGRPPKINKDDDGGKKPTKKRWDSASLGEEAAEGDDEGDKGTATPKKRKPGRPPKNATPQDGDTPTPTKKKKRVDCNISRLPGTKLKICSHCGTVADKVKAKKCYNCKKFFFRHWAQRCKIPPCPSCHFSRKSRRFERIPSNCEKCGFKLPSELLQESMSANMSLEDGDGVESLESSSTSVRLTPDPSEPDSISTEWSECRQLGREVYLETDDEDEEEMEDVVMESSDRKGRRKGSEENMEQAEYSAEENETQQVVTRSISPHVTAQDGATVVMATTRSGRAYKQDTTPERSVVVGSIATEIPSLAGKTVESLQFGPQSSVSKADKHDNTPERTYKGIVAAAEIPSFPGKTLESLQSLPSDTKADISSSSSQAQEMLSTSYTTSLPSTVEVSSTNPVTVPVVTDEVSTKESEDMDIMSTKKPEDTEEGDHFPTVYQNVASQAVCSETKSSSEWLVVSQTVGGSSSDGPALQQLPAVTEDAGSPCPLSPTHMPDTLPSSRDTTVHKIDSTQYATVPSQRDPAPLEKGDVQPSLTLEEGGNSQHIPSTLEKEQSCATKMLVDTDTQIMPCVNPPDIDMATAVDLSTVPVSIIDQSAEQGHKDTDKANVDGVNDPQVMAVSNVRTEDSSQSQCADFNHASAKMFDPPPSHARKEGPVISNLITAMPASQSSAVQTASSAKGMNKKESNEADNSVFRNIDQSLPYLRSVMSVVHEPVVRQDNKNTVTCQTSATLKHTAMSTATNMTSGTQSLPVLFTTNLGLDDSSKLIVVPPAGAITPSGASSHFTTNLAAPPSQSDHLSVIEVSTVTTTPDTLTVVSAPMAQDNTSAPNRDADMVVTESGTLTVMADSLQSGVTGEKMEKKAQAAQKTSKGKNVVGKDGKPTTPKKKKHPKNQEGKEGANKVKPTKAKKPKTKKSKALTASAPSLPEQASTAAMTMLATSIAQELQRKPSLLSPLVPGQHSKHSFSRYFYSEDSKLVSSSSLKPQSSTAGSSGASGGESAIEVSGEERTSVGTKGKSKRAHPKMDSQEPPLKKKKLANIAPNSPLTSTSKSTVSALGPQALKGTSSLTPLTPALLPQLYQLAATLKMSSSNLLSILRSALPAQKTSGSVGASGSSTATSLSSVQNPASLPPAAIFPPLTMSFQSLAAALSNLPIATAPIRLSGTQVTARPLLPSTISSSLQPLSAPSAVPLSMTLPSSFPAMFSSLGTPSSMSGDQLAALKGIFSQSEASVGTQTAIKIDTLKPLIAAGPTCSSLSPQLLTLPNPPQLNSGPVSPSSVPLPPPSLVAKDLQPMFQSVLSQQLPSAPPPLTSSLSTLHISAAMPDLKMTTSVSAMPFPVIKSNTSVPSVSYMTLPMSSGPMFTSLPFHSGIIPPSGKGITTPQMASGGDNTVQPLLLSSLPDPTSQSLPTSLSSLLPPPPHLLPQNHQTYPKPTSLQPYADPESDSTSVTSSNLCQSNPIIPSLLRPDNSGDKPEIGSVSSASPSMLPVSHPVSQQKVIYTQSITSPKVCTGPQPSSTGPSVDSNLQVLVSNVQTRINEALSKSSAGDMSLEPLPLLPPSGSTPGMFSLVPPPLTSTLPITFVSKGGSTSRPPYILPHPPPQKKRGVVITKLPGPLSTALSHTGDLKNRDGSRHSSTSSVKSGDDPTYQIQSVKSDDAEITGFSSAPPTVITLSPSPTASLEEQQDSQAPPTSNLQPHPLEVESDKDTDSFTKLMSEETLASDPSSDGEGGRREGGVCDGAGDQQQTQQPQKSNSANDADGTDAVKTERGLDGEEREGGDGGGRDGDGDRVKGSKKRRKSSSGSSSKKAHMFSVKLKDCFLHHLTWMEYRMVLLVPLGDKQKQKHKHKQQHERHKHSLHGKHSPESQSSASGDKLSAGGSGGGERRRRRKPVLKELSGYNDMEEDEDDTTQSTTSSLHVPGPCFSVYELRNKLFQTLSPNAVYIYTYKNQIKSFKLPIHWVYILKRMGGMLESCHTCRLMDLEHVRGMCYHYGLSLPETLDSLCRNEIPKGRRVIDLSSIEPESLGPLHLEEIPLCSFTEKGRPYKPKAKKNKKKLHKDEEHRARKKGEGQDGERRSKKERRVGKDGSGGKTPKMSTSSLHSLHSVKGEMEVEEEEEEGEGMEGGEREVEGEEETEEREAEGEMEGEGEEVDDWAEEEKKWKRKLKYSKRSPPPLIRHSPLNVASRTKKKPCPFCGAQVLKRSKKCSVCNRNFGVYTFGRKQCLFCGRVNLARMARCNECGQSLDKAPSARPKEDDSSGSTLSHKKSDFIFGVRKRRKVHSVPLAFSGSYHGYLSSSKTRRSAELRSPGESAPVQSEMSGEEEEMEEGRREDEREEEDGEEEEEEEEGEEGLEEGEKKELDAEMSKSTLKSRTKLSSSSTKSKHTGYKYGHIPWADADITVLVDERGVPKFCLQELSTKVLVGHTKAEVFEMVRDLDLPLEQGNIQLLKKLQALGLHANRSPMCKLIASEELWLLLDALQEPVPEEVHQHLENINTSTTPLLSPGGTAGSGVRTHTVVASAPVTTASTEEEEEQTTSFESTLHEMQCSDGQYVSVLRKWNGEQFVCLPEIWRKYFPEVNRNHLSSALRRLMLETHMPTGQQATLLRSAQVISIRGAPGRLMKLEDMQALLDDFCIPLQLASGHTQKHSAYKLQSYKPQKQAAPSTTVSKPASRPVGRPRINSGSSYPTPTALPPGKVLASKEDMEYAECMRHVLNAVDSSDLVALLEQTRLSSEEQAESADKEAADLNSKLNRLSQLILSRRDLCTVLSREMGFLNASVHGYMSEVVRLTHSEKLVLQNLDSLLQSLNVSLS